MASSIIRFIKRLEKHHLVLAALTVFAAVQLPYKLTQVPSFCFDEGNVTSVAHNWLELGHYGLLRNGRPLAEDPYWITVGFPAVAPIALSFHLLGRGVWQARLPGLLFTAGALIALWYLARHLYDRSVATTTLGAALLLPARPYLHPIFVGRQALGEAPALFFLLAGLLCLQRAWDSPRRFLPLAAIFWGLSLQTKPQFFPFLAAALLLPLALLLRTRRFRDARILGFGLFGALSTSLLFAGLFSLIVQGGVSPSNPPSNTLAAIASSRARLLFNVLQLDPGVRLQTAFKALVTATPLLLGLFHAGWRFLRGFDAMEGRDNVLIGRLLLWTLAASWFSWYVLLSIGWLRYLLPAAFLGNVFTAALIKDLTQDFSVPPWERWAAVRSEGHFTVGKLGILASLLALPIALLLTLNYTYAGLAGARGDSGLLETAHFLNTHTEPDALIEIHDRELFFLVDRAYHYPDKEVHHQLKRRVSLDEKVNLDYDPLAAAPDYLVVGPASLQLYGQVVDTRAFRLVHASRGYLVYRRVRSEDGEKG